MVDSFSSSYKTDIKINHYQLTKQQTIFIFYRTLLDDIPQGKNHILLALFKIATYIDLV